MSFNEFILRSQNQTSGLAPILRLGERLYFQQHPPEELEKAVVSSSLQKVNPQNLVLRVTSQNSIHGLHYDVYATGLIQLAGSKRVLLLSPNQFDQANYVARGPQARRSALDLSEIVHQKGQSGLNVLTLTLNAGDVLLFPRLTGHQTEAYTDSFTISFWHVPDVPLQ